jgi:hypothetical protein
MRQQQTHNHAVGFIVELAAEAEVGEEEDMAEEHHDIPSKMSTLESHGRHNRYPGGE